MTSLRWKNTQKFLSSINNLMPDTVLMRKKKQWCSKWTNIILLPVATEQWWSGCAQHRDVALLAASQGYRSWVPWQLDRATGGTAHGHISKEMSQPSNSACCYKQYGHIHAPIRHLYFVAKMMSGCRAWLWKERNWMVFSLTSLLHVGCTPSHLILLSAV